ncbi:MAG: tetratricopeptide repeat protein [Gemmatimonadota bacterium]
MSSLGRRFKERRIVQWGLAYLGGAWVALQVLDALADPWDVPGYVGRALTVILAVGFFVTMVVAWYHGEKGRQRVSGPELLLIGALAVCAGALLSLVSHDEDAAQPSEMAGEATPAENTVAVLPFVDLSADGDQQYFADGLAEEITSALTRDGRVRVAARTSSFSLRDRPIQDVGAALSVAAVLEGSVRTDGDRMRITAQLVNVADGFELWSRQFDRTLESILQTQAEISAAVVAELTGTATAETGRVGTIPAEAYDLYVQGRFAWNRRTERDLLRAVDLFQAAIDRAPDYARARSGLADAYAVLGFYQYLPPDEAFPAAARLAQEALALDPELVEALATLAYVRLYHDWDWQAAEATFLRAVELNPRYSVAHQWYGNLLVVLGRTAEALREFRLAAEIDPLSPIVRAVTPWALYYGREYGQALELLDQLIEVEDRFMLGHYWKGWVQQQTGDLDGALRSFRSAVQLADSSAITLAGLAGAEALAGDTREAEELLQRLADRSRTSNPPPYEIGKVHLALGQVDEAFRWFERAFEERANQLVFIAVDPEVDLVRADLRFRDLLSRMKLD